MSIRTCPLCMTCVASDNLFQWSCAHAAHTTCVAQLRAYNPQPACPHCRLAWTQRDGLRFHTVCSLQDVAPLDTSAIRLAAASDAAALTDPLPPKFILPLCCSRVGEQDRRMRYFPFFFKQHDVDARFQMFRVQRRLRARRLAVHGGDNQAAILHSAWSAVDHCRWTSHVVALYGRDVRRLRHG